MNADYRDVKGVGDICDLIIAEKRDFNVKHDGFNITREALGTDLRVSQVQAIQ